MTEFDLTTLLVDEIYGIHTVKRLLDNYKDRLFVRDHPNKEPEPIDEDISLEHLDEDISDDCVFIKSLVGDLWSVQFNDGNIIAINPKAIWCDRCDRYEFELPENVSVFEVTSDYLPYIINGDCSGLSDEEIEQVDKFLTFESDGITNFHWSYNTDHNNFTRCDISKLSADCVELHLVNMDGING